MKQFKASNKEWQELEGIAKKPANIASRALCELRDRVAALEAAPDRVLVRNQTGEYLRAGTPLRMDSRFYVDSLDLLTSYSVGEARPMEECGKDHAVRYPHSPTTIAECGGPCEQGPEHCDCGQIKPVLATNPSPAKPFVSDKDLWEIKGKARSIDGEVRPSWEYATEHFDESFLLAQIDANRALFDAGVAHATACAEQATAKDSSVAEPEPADPDTPQSLHDVALAHVDTLGRSFGLLPDILDTIRRAIREPMAAPTEPGKVATDEALVECWLELKGQDGFVPLEALRAVYNLGRQHGAPVEQQAPAKPAPKPAPPAPAGGLVDEVMEAAEVTATYAEWALDAVADWLERHQSTHETEPDSIDYAAYLLRQEATR
jgi:hypothetical protein